MLRVAVGAVVTQAKWPVVTVTELSAPYWRRAVEQQRANAASQRHATYLGPCATQRDRCRRFLAVFGNRESIAIGHRCWRLAGRSARVGVTLTGSDARMRIR
jgi:hypothetical protein